MLRSIISAVLRKFGYRIVPLASDIRKDRSEAESSSTGRKPGGSWHRDGYVLYSYLREDGTFDYERYRRIQEEGNRAKLDKVWVVEKNIEFLADYLRKHGGPLRFGICHGTRRGKEQEWFRKYLGCEVIGTEISETATSFPHTLRWDFHEVKTEWLDSVDFIYSNSFDHSFDPERCLTAWMSCLRPGGLCILEHSTMHGPQGADELDPFGAELFQMPYLIARWGRGRFVVREILDAPKIADEWATVSMLAFIVVQRL